MWSGAWSLSALFLELHNLSLSHHVLLLDKFARVTLPHDFSILIQGAHRTEIHGNPGMAGLLVENEFSKH